MLNHFNKKTFYNKIGTKSQAKRFLTYSNKNFKSSKKEIKNINIMKMKTYIQIVKMIKTTFN